jgi:hypothetical protein
MIGKDPLLDHLPADPSKHRDVVTQYGAVCRHDLCVAGDRWADTVLPESLDTNHALPPIIRITQGMFRNRLSAVADTISLNDHDGTILTYKLVSVAYGNSLHFTTCVRYHIDEGDETFYHYDSFHFDQDRVLALSDSVPACMGGKPHFLERHTDAMKRSFHDNTHMRNVIAVIYAILK